MKLKPCECLKLMLDMTTQLMESCPDDEIRRALMLVALHVVAAHKVLHTQLDKTTQHNAQAQA